MPADQQPNKTPRPSVADPNSSVSSLAKEIKASRGGSEKCEPRFTEAIADGLVNLLRDLDNGQLIVKVHNGEIVQLERTAVMRCQFRGGRPLAAPAGSESASPEIS
jgi:hypothetical protein